MPAAVAAAIAADAIGTYVAEAVIFDLVAATTLDWVATYAVIQAGASFVSGAVLRGALSGGAEDAPSSPSFTAQAQARTHVIRSAVANRTIVYGRAMVSGPLVFAATSADNNTLHLVIAIAGHEIDAVEEIYFNDELVGTRDGSGNVTSGDYSGYAQIVPHLGAADQVADADLVAANVGWTANHRLRGVAYLYLKLTWSRDVYPRGIPNIKAVVRGKKLYDSRSGLTVWSDNWALACRDYLAYSGGLACLPAEIDDTAAGAAANIADEAVALAAGGTEPRYTANGVIDTGNTPKANMLALLSGGAGAVTWPAGIYTLHAGAYTAPEVTLDEDDLRGPIRLRTRAARQDLYNAVKGTFVDPNQAWQPVDFPAITSATYAAQDGGETIWHDVAFPVTTSSATAQRLAKIALEKSRQGITVEAPCKLTAFKVAVWDTVRESISHLGWSAKEFKVTGWKFNEGGGVDLTLQEEAAACYTWSAEETLTDPAPDTNLPTRLTAAPGVPLVVESLYETRSGGGVKAKATVSWAAADDVFASDYRLEYKLAADSAWTVLPRTSALSVEIFDIAPATYDFRVKALSAIGSGGPYATNSGVEIRGLLARPADLTGLTIQAAGGLAILHFDLHPDLDVRIGGKIQFRHATELTGALWESSVSIGNAVNGNTTVAVLPLKSGTYLAKAIDSSGLTSVNAVSISSKQASVLAFSSVDTVQDDATFTGTHSSTVVDGGVLMLTGAGMFDDIPDFDDEPALDFAGGVNASGTYNFATGMDLTSVQRVRLTTTVAAEIVNVRSPLDSRDALLDTWEDFDGLAGADADCVIEVRETDNDPAGSPTWSAWKRLDAAEFEARAFQFRARLLAGDPSYNINVSQLRVIAESV